MQSNDQNTSHTQSAMLAGPTGKYHCETNTRDWVTYTLSMQCAGTVHVKLLEFFCWILWFAIMEFLECSQKVSAECPYPVRRLTAGTYCRTLPLEDSLCERGVRTLALLMIYELRMYHIHVFTCDILFFCVGRCAQREETQSVSDTPQQRVPTCERMWTNAEHLPHWSHRRMYVCAAANLRRRASGKNGGT